MCNAYAGMTSETVDTYLKVFVYGYMSEVFGLFHCGQGVEHVLIVDVGLSRKGVDVDVSDIERSHVLEEVGALRRVNAELICIAFHYSFRLTDIIPLYRHSERGD